MPFLTDVVTGLAETLCSLLNLFWLSKSLFFYPKLHHVASQWWRCLLSLPVYELLNAWTWVCHLLTLNKYSYKVWICVDSGTKVHPRLLLGHVSNTIKTTGMLPCEQWPILATPSLDIHLYSCWWFQDKQSRLEGKPRFLGTMAWEQFCIYPSSKRTTQIYPFIVKPGK